MFNHIHTVINCNKWIIQTVYSMKIPNNRIKTLTKPKKKKKNTKFVDTNVYVLELFNLHMK